MNKQTLTLRAFDVKLFAADKRQQRHRGVDGFADELHVSRISPVHLETSEQRSLSERKRMIAEERVVIAQQLIVHAEALQTELMLNNCLHIGNKLLYWVSWLAFNSIFNTIYVILHLKNGNLSHTLIFRLIK